MPVICVRASHEPAVPSNIVTCERCGSDCWISKESGQRSLLTAMALGQPGVLCESCWQEEVGEPVPDHIPQGSEPN